MLSCFRYIKTSFILTFTYFKLVIIWSWPFISFLPFVLPYVTIKRNVKIIGSTYYNDIFFSWQHCNMNHCPFKCAIEGHMLWFCRLIVLLWFRYFDISAFSANLLLAGWRGIARTSSFLHCTDLWEAGPPLFLLWKLKGTEISFAYLLCR